MKRSRVLLGGLLATAGIGWLALAAALLDHPEADAASGFGQVTLVVVGLIIMSTASRHEPADPTTRAAPGPTPEHAIPNDQPGPAGNRIHGHISGTAIQARAIYGNVNIGPPLPQNDSLESPIIVTAKVAGRALVHGNGVGGHTSIEVLVEARDSQAVILQNIEPIAVSRGPLIILELAAPVPIRGFQVYFDMRSASIYLDRCASSPPEVDFPFAVTASEPELFRLAVKAASHVRFVFRLTWTRAGSSGTTVISDVDDKPFTYP